MKFRSCCSRNRPRIVPFILMMAFLAGVAPCASAGDKASDHLSKGMVLAENGDINGAIVEYRKALKLNPDFVDAHNNLGLALEKNKHLDGAIAEFRNCAIQMFIFFQQIG